MRNRFSSATQRIFLREPCSFVRTSEGDLFRCPLHQVLSVDGIREVSSPILSQPWSALESKLCDHYYHELSLLGEELGSHLICFDGNSSDYIG